MERHRVTNILVYPGITQTRVRVSRYIRGNKEYTRPRDVRRILGALNSTREKYQVRTDHITTADDNEIITRLWYRPHMYLSYKVRLSELNSVAAMLFESVKEWRAFWADIEEWNPEPYHTRGEQIDQQSTTDMQNWRAWYAKYHLGWK